jgi:hypothetical protein
MKLAHPSLVALAAVLALAGCNDRRDAPPPASSFAAPSAQVPEHVAAPAPPPVASVAPQAVVPASDRKPADVDKPSKSASAELSVKRLVVARSIDRREPEGVSTAFWQGDFDKLYAFVELKNPSKTEQKIVVSFVSPSGKATKGNVELAVGAAPRWRTWAYSRAVDQKGTWTAVVSTPDGKELARAPFEVL